MRRPKRRKLKAACLGASLATAWSGGAAKAADYRVSGYLEPTQDLEHIAVMVSFLGSNTSYENRLVSLGLSAPAGERTPFSLDVLDDPDDYGNVLGVDGFSVLGIYDDASDGVTIAMRPSVAQPAIDAGTSWAQQFGAYAATEGQVAAWLRAPTAQQPRLGWYGFEGWIGEQATLVSFPPATYAGIAYAEAVVIPEPASWLALCLLGTLAVAARRR